MLSSFSCRSSCAPFTTCHHSLHLSHALKMGAKNASKIQNVPNAEHRSKSIHHSYIKVTGDSHSPHCPKTVVPSISSASQHKAKMWFERTWKGGLQVKCKFMWHGGSCNLVICKLIWIANCDLVRCVGAYLKFFQAGMVHEFKSNLYSSLTCRSVKSVSSLLSRSVKSQV